MGRLLSAALSPMPIKAEPKEAKKALESIVSEMLPRRRKRKVEELAAEAAAALEAENVAADAARRPTVGPPSAQTFGLHRGRGAAQGRLSGLQWGRPQGIVRTGGGRNVAAGQRVVPQDGLPCEAALRRGSRRVGRCGRRDRFVAQHLPRGTHNPDLRPSSSSKSAAASGFAGAMSCARLLGFPGTSAPLATALLRGSLPAAVATTTLPTTPPTQAGPPFVLIVEGLPAALNGAPLVATPAGPDSSEVTGTKFVVAVLAGVAALPLL